MRRVGALAALALGAGLGCHSDMIDQPKFRPLERSDFFADGNSSRPQVEGTVARGQLRSDELLHTGKEGGQPSERFPFAVDPKLLERGRERFEIFCAPCHGRLGDGQGMIVQRGFKIPPSFHIDRLRQAAPGYLFDVITNGFGAMVDYRGRISPADRWAIVAYVRALQLSQHLPASRLAAQERGRLESGS